MASTFFGLNIATSGLYTYQAALNTTAHNASNVETDGYTRQVLNTSASTPISIYTSYGMVGTGVTGTSITQIRDEYYDTKYRTCNSTLGTYSKKSYYMTQIENYFNELNDDGFLTAFTNMTGALQDLQTDPTSSATRTSVSQYASSMTTYINSVAQSLQTVQSDANTEIKTSVDRINSLSQQIAMLTKQINTLEVSGQTANDLRDSRNNLIDELSTYANVTVSENVVSNSTGTTTYVVKLDGKILVNGSNYNTLQCVPREDKVNETDADGLYDLYWSDGEEFASSSTTLTGALAGLFAVRDGNNNTNFSGTVSSQETTDGTTYVTITDASITNELLLNIPSSGTIQLGNYSVSYTGVELIDDGNGNLSYKFALDSSDSNSTKDFTGQKASIGDAVDYKGIPYYMSKLNEYVRTLSQSVNDIHKTGTNLNGDTDVDFFTATDAVTGEDLTLHASDDTITSSNSYWQMTALNFSVSSEVLSDPNAIATAYSTADGEETTDLLKDLIAKLGDTSMFNEGSPTTFITAIVADVGIYSKEASSAETGQETILSTIETQRMSISGVDTDEEAMNLVRYQNAYNLSAKVMQIMDEIYDKLINYTGA